MVLGDQIDVMLLRVVEHGVGDLAWAILSSVFLVRLVLELVDNKYVLAEFGGKSSGLLNIDTEVKLLVEELFSLFDHVLFWEFIIITLHACRGNWPAGWLKNSLLSLVAGASGVQDLDLLIVFDAESQVLELQVGVTDENRLGRVPERIC